MQHATEKVKILGGGAMVAKLRRMAYQIYEKNFDQQALEIVAIGQKGTAMAHLLLEMLTEISPLRLTCHTLWKQDDGQGVRWEGSTPELAGKVVIVVDDVLYSGQTMFQGVAEVMRHQPSKVQVAVLIDRGHRQVPVTHDYVGMVLATSLRQYVSVEFDDDQSKASVYLY